VGGGGEGRNKITQHNKTITQNVSEVFLTRKPKLDVVMNACNPSTWLRQEKLKFEVSLAYIARHCLKKEKRKKKKEEKHTLVPLADYLQ
jgi:hypothetical protein